MARAATALAIAVTCSVALAQSPGRPGTAGSTSQQMEGPVQIQEVDVVQTDGGTFAPSVAPGAQVTPPELVEPSPAPYPESLKAAPISGTVELELLVDEKGAVQEVKLATPAHPALDAAAFDAAWKLRFNPGRLGDQPVPVRLRYSYVFEAPPPPPVMGTLGGEVRQKGTRKPLAGAALLDEQGKAVAETGPDGRFKVELPPGAQGLTIQAPGHVPLKTQETITANQGVEVVYRLEPLVVDPYETIVRGERERSEVSRHTLQSQELREVPGTQGDPFRVVMLLPGVSSIASGISYPVVRGSQPAATGYSLDGVRIPALFHLVLGPAVVHPDFLERIDFYPSVPPPQYGRVLGGVVDGLVARTRDDRIHASLYADVVNAGGFLELPVQQSGTNVTVAGRVSYTPWLVARVAEAVTPEDSQGYKTRPVADFYDYQARVEQDLGAARKLRLLAFGSSDVVGTDSLNPDGVDVLAYTRFHRVDLRYRQPLPLGEIEAGATYGYEAVGVEGTFGFSGDTGNYDLTTNNFAARAIWRYAPGEQWSFSSGVDLDLRRAKSGLRYEYHPLDPFTGQPGEAAILTLTEPLTIGTFFGGYANAAWQPTKQWTISAGARVDSYHLTPRVQRAALEPRVTARFSPFEGLTFKGGAGIVHQAPTVLLNVPVLDISGLRWGLQESRQVDVGAEWALRSGLELNVDLYFHDIPQAIEFDLLSLLQNQRRSSLFASSLVLHGRSYGLEVMLRHPLGGNWFGWISYSLQRSERFQRYVHFDESFQPVEARQSWLPFAFDQTHVFNAVLSYKFPGNITAGGVLHFNSGRPESGSISSRTMYEYTDPDTGFPSWRAAGRDEVARLPWFARLDLRVAKQWTYDDYRVEVYLDVLNATLSNEILGYTYAAELLPGPEPAVRLFKEEIKIPVVVPMLGVKGTY